MIRVREGRRSVLVRFKEVRQFDQRLICPRNDSIKSENDLIDTSERWLAEFDRYQQEDQVRACPGEKDVIDIPECQKDARNSNEECSEGVIGECREGWAAKQSISLCFATRRSG